MSDDFHVTYPSWILVHESSLATDEQGIVTFADQIAFVTLEDTSRQRCLPVFTDEDLATRFIDEAQGMDEVRAIAAEDPAMLGDFLAMATGVAAFVVFDPQTAVGWNRRVWLIEHVIQRLLMDQGEQ